MSHLAVGEAMTAADIDDLPIGTTISSSMTSPHRYLRLDDVSWQEVANPIRMHQSSAFGNGYVVISYPEGYVPTPLTTSDFKWRFRNATLHAAHNHSVRIDAVVQALNEMGAGFADLPLTVGQVLRNIEDIQALPEGSLVQTGRPETFGTFGLFVLRDEEIYHVLGPQTTLRRATAVLADLPPDYVPPECAEDEAALNAFKVKAYLIGLKTKNAQDWCSTYEAIVRPFGISADEVRPLLTHSDLIGTRVNADGAADLPVGTVLSWSNEHPAFDAFDAPEHGACSWFVRVDGAGNKAGTRRIFAHAHEGVTGRPGHFSNSMTVRYVPNEVSEAEMLLGSIDGLDVSAHWDLLPPGTILSWRSSNFYLMMRNHTATQFAWHPGVVPQLRDHGDYRRDAFGSPQDLRVVAFPAVGAVDE